MTLGFEEKASTQLLEVQGTILDGVISDDQEKVKSTRPSFVDADA